MKSCPDWQEELLDYALGVPAAPGLLEHLERCPACARRLAAWQSGGERLDAGVRRLVHSEPPPDLAPRVLARIQTEPASAGWAARSKPLLAAAALAVLVSLSVYAFRMAAVRREEARKLNAAAAAISSWRAPTAPLLRSALDPLLKTTPKLGETFFEINIAPERTRKTGGKNEK